MLSRLQTVFASFEKHQVKYLVIGGIASVLHGVPRATFDEAWGGRVTMSYRGQDFFVASRQHLIASKKAAARVVDLEDVRLLELLDEPSDESS